jgi:diketogulonate reductase-like aldo/keto reductase
MTNAQWTRRDVLVGAGALALAPVTSVAAGDRMRTRRVPATGEQLPVIGLGTYDVFDVASTEDAIETRKKIVDILIANGGSVIDTSPMYNRSEKVIGDIVAAGVPRERLFLATKVWTDGKASGEAQMQKSADLMGANVIDLMQVHNLRDTAVHMATIRDWQDEGRIRYNGLTHYRADAHDDLEAAMKRYEPQFIQINYSLGEREADDRVLPLARDMGTAVLINRPFQAGALFRAVGDRPLPDWASEFADSWGQFFLKYIISHPAVTSVIPATSKPHHMRDNAQAGVGPLPEAAVRARMVEFIEGL